MANYAVSKGLDLPISGRASGDMIQLDAPESVALDPQEISGFIPRLLAKEGDAVKRGSPILYHKTHPEIRLVAPVAGRLNEVRRGLRRVITDVVFEADGDDVVAF